MTLQMSSNSEQAKAITITPTRGADATVRTAHLSSQTTIYGTIMPRHADGRAKVCVQYRGAYVAPLKSDHNLRHDQTVPR